MPARPQVLTPTNFSSVGLPSPFYIDSFTFYLPSFFNISDNTLSTVGAVNVQAFVYEWDASTFAPSGAPVFAGEVITVTAPGPVKVDTGRAGPLDPSKSYILYFTITEGATDCAVLLPMVSFNEDYPGLYFTSRATSVPWFSEASDEASLALEAVFSY